jgi:hypothetical protein
MRRREILKKSPPKSPPVILDLFKKSCIFIQEEEKMKKLILFAISIALLLSGCTSSDGTGNFMLYLTDKPIDNAEEIWVTISEINVQKSDEGFFTVWSGSRDYDLLKLRSKEEEIVNVTLDEGTYTQIRLVVTAGRILIAGESEPYIMTVPSSEVKIPYVFNVMEDGATKIVLDFEAEHSIHVVGAGLSGKYILTPVIKVKSVTY